MITFRFFLVKPTTPIINPVQSDPLANIEKGKAKLFMDVQDKVVIITGASQGIGLATARLFAQQGAKVVLAARSTDSLNATVDELNEQHHEAIAVPTDMRDRKAIESLVEGVAQRYGHIDILINNAGQAVQGNIADVDIDQFRQVFELNVLGPVQAMQAVIPQMRQNGGGLIINVSSNVTQMHLPVIGAYASTKAALNMISDTAREELATDNIRVTTMFPGMTATNFGHNSLASATATRMRPPANAQVDSAEDVAQKILEAARNEPDNQYMDH
jgi:short-subunit dehydrogenase